MLVGGENPITVLAEVALVEPGPEILGDAEDLLAQGGRRRGRVRVQPAPRTQLEQRWSCDLAGRQHRGNRVDGELALGLCGVLKAQHALRERLVEERERLSAGGVRHAAQGGA